MGIFLTESDGLDRHLRMEPLRGFYWAMINRVAKRAQSPGLSDVNTTTDWWHHASEFLTDAAMVQALKPSEQVATWLRSVCLEIARRPVTDWVGPAFRYLDKDQPVGHLETAHLSWALAVVLDLAATVFTDDEYEEVAASVREKGMALCQRWLDQHDHIANWRCVLNAGVAVAAAVLDDVKAIERAVGEYQLDVDSFQPDGSYSESLQYGNYAGYALMLTREALIRRDPSLGEALPMEPWVLKPRWDAASLFYMKPLSGWGGAPRPRSANFNDSAAIYGASGDFLLHIAARASDSHPTEAGLARWLFDQFYAEFPGQGPNDRASFGFVNDFGFLTLSLLPKAAEAISPEKAGLTELESFSVGDHLVRDTWGGRTVLAVHSAPGPLYGPGHLHGDLNSFILVHNQERLLVDPGHSCYRGLVHGIEIQSATHNTCTFNFDENGEDALEACFLEQSHRAQRRFDRDSGKANPPVVRGGRSLLKASSGAVRAIGSEVSDLYGSPLTEFSRFWFLCGANALFVVDCICSDHPVRTSWNWLFNNRDDALDLKLAGDDRLVARRGRAGMKLFHLGGGRMQSVRHAFVHDAYHPLPRQLGEGMSGSGQLLSWSECSPLTKRVVVHAIALDDPGAVAGWHLKQVNGQVVLEGPEDRESWSLSNPEDGTSFEITEVNSGNTWQVAKWDGVWAMHR